MMGWTAIAMALFSLVPGIVPGAVSLFGLMISMVALILSAFSVTQDDERYFRTTAIIVIAGVFLVNGTLGLWQPPAMPFAIKLGLYGLVFVVGATCALIVRRRKRAQSKHGKSVNEDRPAASG